MMKLRGPLLVIVTVILTLQFVWCLMVYCALSQNYMRSADVSREVHNVQRQFNYSDDKANNQGKKLNNGKPVKHVAFLKVHKAASTTTQNIFFRYGLKTNAVFALPMPMKLGYPNIISNVESVTKNNTIPPPNNGTFDILCCHVLYNRNAFEAVMPKDTVYIGLVRNPFDHFKSILNYFRPQELLNLTIAKPITMFLRNPRARMFKAMQNPKYSFLNNRMAVEYDFPKDIFKSRDDEAINKYLQKLDKEFQLVIVVELFDESIVLLRRLLNWNMKDVLFVTKNVKHELFKKIKFQPGDVELHKQWAKLDYALYSFFYQRLMEQINQHSDFYGELFHFKTLNADVSLYCKRILRHKPTEIGYEIEDFVVQRSDWNEPFSVTPEDCAYMTIGEIKAILAIRYKQYGNYTKYRET